MDPDAALENAQDALSRFRNTQDEDMRLDAANDLAEAFAALDGWLSRGGFAPADWNHRHNPPMIVVESSTQLDSIRTALNSNSAHKLRVWIDGDAVKFKVNERTWSPPMGRIQEPY